MRNRIDLIALLPFTIVLGIMFSLNRLAPMMADDFCYAASTLSEVWNNMVRGYFTWNGRAVAHLIGPLFTLTASWVFDLANTIVFGLLLILMVVLARGSRFHWADLSSLPAVAFPLLWFGIPDFGQTVLWQMGSANYLWTTTIVLAFLIPYRYLMDGIDVLRKPVGLSILFPIFAVVSGWTNENTAATAWLLAAAAVISVRLRSRQTPAWAVAALVGHALGLALMVMSPGHHVRSASPVFQAWGELSWPTKIIRFAPNAVGSVVESWVVWVAVIGAAVLLFRNRLRLDPIQRADSRLAVGFGIASVLNNLVLVLAPAAPPRALTGGAVYLSIAAIILIDASTRFVTRRTLALAAAGGLCALTISITGVTAEYYRLDHLVNQRQSAIDAAHDNNKSSLVLDAIVVPRSRHMYWGSITDITYHANHWANMCFARYIGFDSVRLVSPLEDGSTVPLGPGSPIAFKDGVTIDEVGYSPEHACLSVVLSSPEPGLIEGSFLDVRVLSDASPWYRRVMDRLRRRWFPATTARTFEYPHSRLRKIAVFSSFNIHSIFLDDQAIVNVGGRLVVFVPLTENARNITTLLIGKRRAHDATMLLHRIQ